jgi:hypothetical protein
VLKAAAHGDQPAGPDRLGRLLAHRVRHHVDVPHGVTLTGAHALDCEPQLGDVPTLAAGQLPVQGLLGDPAGDLGAVHLVLLRVVLWN